MGDKMGDQATDFTSLFHSLQGDTISDRKKNFNKLLKNPAFSANKQIVQDALDKLEPKTYLEGLFKVDALIFFRHTARLLEIMKGGNEVFMSKILKQNWFFEEVFRNMDAKVLVNEFLPCLSFTMRMKVLKRLSVVMDEHKMDDIYDCVYERYGLFIATKFLHTCTREKLEYVFSKEEIKLRVHQVLHLFNRNSDFFDLYVHYYKKTFDRIYEESKIIHYIALKNPELLLKLEKQSVLSVMCLGRRTSKKMIDTVKDGVKLEYDYYKNLLNKSVLIRKLGKEFNSIYFKMFPKNVSCINRQQDYISILRFYPKNRKYNLLVDTYSSKVADADLNALYLLLGDNVMSLNPSREVIQKWAKCNYEKNRDESFLKYYPTSESIPLIKEKINVTSDIQNRKSLVYLLVKTCKENKDLNALEGVLKYFCSRHRNEDFQFKNDFLAIISRSFNLQEFNKTHWCYLLEIVKVLEIQKQLSFYRFSVFLGRHLEFLVKNGENYEEYLKEYLSYRIKESNRYNVELENPNIESILLKDMIAIFPNCINNFPEDWAGTHREYKFNFVATIIEFSEKYPDNFIDIGEQSYFKNFLDVEIDSCLMGMEKHDYALFNIIDSLVLYIDRFPQCTLPKNDEKTVRVIIQCCNNDGYNAVSRCIKHFILKKPRNVFECRLLSAFFEHMYLKVIDQKIIDWFLANEPAVLIPYFSGLCRNSYNFNCKLVKLLSHFGFDENVCQIYLGRLDSGITDDYENIVDALKVMMPTSKFAELIDKKIVPTKTKLDLEDPEMKKMYDVQCRIAKKLHLVEEPVEILPVVLKFCIGDYLQSCLPSFYGVFYRSPEKELYQHTVDLSKKAVSVRKHAVFLSCELFEQKLAMKNLLMEDGNVSSQKHLFTATLKYFRKNPSQELLNLTIKNMSTIDKNDTETLESLVSVTVPKKYRGFYIQKCWEFYESMKTGGVVVDGYLENLLRNVTHQAEVLVSLTPKFIENIVENYFCKSLDSHTVFNFVINFLIFTEIPIEKYIESILNKFKTAEREMKSFIEILCNSKLTKKLLVSFAEKFTQYFDLLDAFEEHLKIKLLLIRFNSNKKDLAKNILTYLHELIEKFTLNVLKIFENIFSNFLSHMNTRAQYDVLCDALELEQSAVVCILILSVIRPINDDEDENFDLYQRIIEIVKKIQEPIVLITFKKYLSDNGL